MSGGVLKVSLLFLDVYDDDDDDDDDNRDDGFNRN